MSVAAALLGLVVVSSGPPSEDAIQEGRVQPVRARASLSENLNRLLQLATQSSNRGFRLSVMGASRANGNAFQGFGPSIILLNRIVLITVLGQAFPTGLSFGSLGLCEVCRPLQHRAAGKNVPPRFPILARQFHSYFTLQSLALQPEPSLHAGRDSES